MRHKVYGRHLSRNTDERKALFKNLVQSLILSEKIETTEQKAKSIKPLVDKLISSASAKNNPNTNKLVGQYLYTKVASEKLFKEIVPRLGTRKSGFTGITRLSRRPGDNATIVQMRLLLEEPMEKGGKVSQVSQGKEAEPAKGNLLSRARAGVSRSRGEKKEEPKKAVKKEAKK